MPTVFFKDALTAEPDTQLMEGGHEPREYSTCFTATARVCPVKS